MISIFETINNLANSFTNNSVPPIMRGTKSIIQKMAVEERKIARLNQEQYEKVTPIIREKEDISEIFTKYVNKDFNKEVYLFIK